jgi:hypothetical protein
MEKRWLDCLVRSMTDRTCWKSVVPEMFVPRFLVVVEWIDD